MTKKNEYVGTREFDQGRAAFRGAISIDDAPYAEDDKHLEAWKAGYEFEKSNGALSRESTEGDVSEVRRLAKEGKDG